MITVAAFALCFSAAAAWPHQTEAEIAMEAAREAREFEKWSEHHVLGKMLSDASKLKPNTGKENNNYCPDGQHFHKCNVAGMNDGAEYNCGNVLNFFAEIVRQGKMAPADMTASVQQLSKSCCSSDLPGPDDDECAAEKPPSPMDSPCPAVEKSKQCVDGYRTVAECASKWYEGSKSFGCKENAFGGAWCSHDAVYHAFVSNYSSCEECFEEVASPYSSAKFLPLIESLRCLPVEATAGNAEGRIVTFANDDPEKLKSTFPAFSAGKVVGAVALVAMVNDGTLTWDLKPSEVFDWWTKDEKDPRSRVTFRHLLTFTSGFVGLPSAFSTGTMSDKCVVPGLANFYSPEACAKQIYETAFYAAVDGKAFMNKTTGVPGAEPGSFFQYNSYHMQIALGMATKVAKKDARDLMKKYIFDVAGMKDSHFWGGQNPFLAGGLVTSMNDFDRFLAAFTSYKALPKAMCDIMQTNVIGDASNCPGCTVKPFDGTPPSFLPFAMGGGLLHNGWFQWGGNIMWSVVPKHGYYTSLAYNGVLPYHSTIIPWNTMFGKGEYGSLMYGPMLTEQFEKAMSSDRSAIEAVLV